MPKSHRFVLNCLNSLAGHGGEEDKEKEKEEEKEEKKEFQRTELLKVNNCRVSDICR